MPAEITADQSADCVEGQDCFPIQTYVRPIVRGKENKPVEFGTKAHILQVNGLAFIDKLEFKAFNECTRLKLAVTKHKRLFGPARQLGTDRI